MSQLSSALHRLRRLAAALGPRWDARDEDERPVLAVTFCVLAAVLLWVLLTLSEMQTVDVRVPTEVVGLPSGMALVSAPPGRVRVTLEGQGFDLLKVFSSVPSLPIQALDDRVDLSDQAQLFDLPAGVALRAVTPSVLQLERGRSATVRVPVRPQFDLSFAETFDLSGPVQVAPDSVDVTGAEVVVRGLTSWPLAVRPAFANVRDTLRLNLPLSDSLSNLVSLSASEVDVVVPVGAFTGASREVEIQVVGAPTTERIATLDPPTVQLRFRVLLSQYRRAMETPLLRAVVSNESVQSDNTNFVVPQIQVPAGLVIRDLTMTPAIVGYYTVTMVE
jgi:hypothetical protein